MESKQKTNNSATTNNQTLIEKYFPREWDQLILPAKLKKQLEEIKGQKGYRLLLYSSPGTGKCLGKGTKVLMFDGSIKNVEDVVVGDQLMGMDSTPRNVLSIARGTERILKIKPTKGQEFTCNESHILSLIESGSWDYRRSKLPQYIEDIEASNVEKDMKKIKWYRKKLFRVPLDFPKQEVGMDPYWLGYWLGDGTRGQTHISMSEEDYEEIKQYLIDFASNIGVFVKTAKYNDGINCLRVSFNTNEDRFNIERPNPIRDFLKHYGLFEEKHIPKCYLINDKETRLQIAAGLVDSDGTVTKSMNHLDFTFVCESLANDVAWLFRSLGFNVSRSFKKAPKITDKEYYRLSISGELSQIPVKHERKRVTESRKQIKNHLVTGFEIEDIGVGDYYGFTLDGDGRFLLEDFTVTHNTTTARLLSLDCEVMYLSGSNDFNIETLRQKVMAFSAGMSVNNKQKNVIIDEFENIRDNLQDAFKIILDQCKRVNFIFITNEVEKVNSAVRSRCTNIDYNFIGDYLDEHKKLYVQYIVKICKENNIEYEPEGLKQLYIRNFPDFRHVLVNIQQIKDSGSAITVDSVKDCNDDAKQMKDLYEIIEDHFISSGDLYTKLSTFKGNEKECLISLGEPYFRYLNDKNMFDKTLEAAMVVSKYCNMYNNTINKFVTFISCITELRTLFR